MNMIKTHLTGHALWLRFIITWVLLHSGILLVLTVGWMIWPLLAFIIIPGSYSILLRGDHSHPGKLGLSTCVGGVISLVVLTVIKGVVLTVIKDDGLFVMGVIGMVTGVANIPLLPWRGVRTAIWPLINTLGGIVAYTVLMDVDKIGIGVVLVSGAIYGLITGPVLVTILHTDRSTTA